MPTSSRPARPAFPLAALAAAAFTLTAACGGSDAATSPPAVAPPVATGPAVRPALGATYRASGHAAAGDVFVHLFEWRWADIASECETALGPAGYRAVQVSPPQEAAVIAGFPWWQRYQPVSYSIDRSRSGTRAEFAAMVSRCKAAGVDIYVDAVLDHMTAGAGTGSNGTVYTKYNYPGTWQQADFHAPCAVSNYQDPANVQDCELLGLADLNTGSASVRQRLADYLMYAEAFLRGGGGDQATALGYVNALRARVGAAPITADQLTLDFLLDERGRELFWEGHRRTDLVRFGRFTGGTKLWTYKGGVPSGTATPATRDLYPLPANELSANPSLKQNPGY